MALIWRPLAVFVVVLTAYLVALNTANPHTTGDEPHYLIIAHSIVHDRDLALDNNYADPALVARAYAPVVLDTPGHAATYEPNGPLRPVHNIGLPLLLTVSDVLGGDPYTARTLMVILTALISPLLVLILDRLLPGHRFATTVATLGTMLSPPVLTFSLQIYPDVPGALLVVAAVALLVLGGRRPLPMLGSSVAAALLPWFHIRLAVFSIAIAAALGVLALRSRAEQVTGETPATRWWHHPRRPEQVKLLMYGLMPLVVSALAILLENQHLYGEFSPNAAYQSPPFPSRVGFQREGLETWTPGQLFSRSAGIVPLAPILLLSLAGLVLVVLRWRIWGTVAVAAGVVYYVASTGIAFSGGFCPPGRWTVAVAPALAVPLAVVLAQGWRTGLVAAVLLPYSLAVSVVTTRHYWDLYSYADDYQTLRLIRTVAPLWPALSDTPPGDRFTFGAAHTAHSVGTLTDGVVTTTAADGLGNVALSAAVDVRSGSYTATFDLPEVSGPTGATLGLVAIVSNDVVIASRPIVAPATGRGPLVLTLSAPTNGDRIQLLVNSTGTGTIAARQEMLLPESPNSVSPPEPTHRKAQLLLWLGILTLLVLLALGRAPLTLPWRGRTRFPPRPNAGARAENPAATAP